MIARDPEHAAALNYLGYMLAERGERLDESVELIKRALAIDPDNGSYLDSLGWAYFKDGKLDLAVEQPEARRRLSCRPIRSSRITTATCSFKLRPLRRGDRRMEACARRRRRRRSIASDIDRKIRSARQKLPKR